jgi:hypothetical protein
MFAFTICGEFYLMTFIIKILHRELKHNFMGNRELKLSVKVSVLFVG